ncbi:MAG: hypothetical protein ACLP3C_03320 [Mycobacterium sp.]
MLSTVHDQLSLWDAILPSELLVCPTSWRGGMRCWMIRVVVCQQLGMR